MAYKNINNEVHEVAIEEQTAHTAIFFLDECETMKHIRSEMNFMFIEEKGAAFHFGP